MEMVALVPGSGRTVGLPLPELDLTRPPLHDTAGDLSPDGADPVVRVTAAASQAERLATVVAAFRDEMVAGAYREGAAEYASRLTHLPPARRREWGARAMLAELACALRVPEGTLARRLARQSALAGFPRFREANLAGDVSSWHCDVMLDVFGHVADEASLAAADAALIDRALALTPSELRVVARRWRARHVPRTEAERARNLADRHVAVTPADDDLCWLSALLPAPQAMAIYHRLSDVAAAVAGPDEPRTPDQLRADVLCDLLLPVPAARTAAGPPRMELPRRGAVGTETALAESGEPTGVGDGSGAEIEPAGGACGLGGIVPTVLLTVPVLSLLGRGDEPADLEGFGPIDIETARELAAQAPSFIRVLTHPETGAVLSVSRDRYRVPADLRAALVIRDETCRFPGCRRRAMSCDIDHARAWQQHGCTDVDNLEHLCRKHHRLKHEVGWRVDHEGGGVISWTSPVGRRYRTEPATTLGPGRAATTGPGRPPPRGPAGRRAEHPPAAAVAGPSRRGSPDELTF
jgi:hypothetical protein